MANNHTFKVGDTVKTKANATNPHVGGKIRYIACGNARPSVGTCLKNACTHDPKDYIWVLWPGKTTTVSYLHSDLELDPNATQQPGLGNQVSSPAGPPGVGMPVPPTVASDKPADTKPLPIETAVEHFKSKVKETEVLDANDFDWKSYNSRSVTDSKGKAKPHVKF